MNLSAWLRGLGLGQYEQAFRDNAIQTGILPQFTAEDLKELGVTLIGHRRKLLDAIAALRVADTPAGEAPRERPPASATPTDPVGEHRQVTVLFADLSGSTSWGQQLDAEEVHALLKQFFDRADRAVQEHGGHILRHIGDCVMAIFGAPVAHDDNAQRAPAVRATANIP
jgi:class 3 adenylate cyclase